uniref:G domain-containing protein n=1 Tax=Cucumis melo TaxID=3656 RepID=A0A9I9DBV3_CUCME
MPVAPRLTHLPRLTQLPSTNVHSGAKRQCVEENIYREEEDASEDRKSLAESECQTNTCATYTRVLAAMPTAVARARPSIRSDRRTAARMWDRVIVSPIPFKDRGLVPREAVEKWLNYMRELHAVAFKRSTQEQRSNLEVDHSVLFYLIKKSITVGVIGLPNVGKSSLINSLKRSHVVNVGATPGLTRSMQEVHLDKNVKLLDCSGVVMLRTKENEPSIALRNCKRTEKLEDPVASIKYILKLCPSKTLVTLYKLSSFDTVDDFLQKVAVIRGKLKKGGIVDIGAAARIVLHDWNEGKIPYYTIPPIRSQIEPSEARIVIELRKDFNMYEVMVNENVDRSIQDSKVLGNAMDNSETNQWNKKKKTMAT